MVFISCRGRLIVILAGAAREQWGLMGVNTGRLFGLKYRYKLVVDMVTGGIRKFLYDAYLLAFLKRELMGFGVYRYW